MIAGFPDAVALSLALSHPNDPNFKAQAIGLRLTPAKKGSKKGSLLQPVYWDDGNIMSCMTTIVTHEQNQVTLGGGLLAKVGKSR